MFTDDWLPPYSIVIALYREAAAVKGLVAALRDLDYPLEKLDIKLVLEPDDHETRDAVARLQLGPPFEIIVAPAGGPRTKPKALNAALSFVRGPFVAVFDAEDRPEPDQLRLALEAFVAGDERLACVQARLTIDNTADSWLTRMFTAEYAGLFDVFLPGLAAWRLPLPLGGSSNHFRTAVLRQVGAWDEARTLRLSLHRHCLQHLRRGAAPLESMASSAHAMVQRMDPDVPGSHALAAAPCPRIGLARIRGVPASDGRHGAGGSGPRSVRGAAWLDLRDHAAGR
jgi:hypothetical protein